jgi:selenocysteine lyase/cysteine desulfurase
VIQPAGIAPLARAEFALDPGLAYFNHAAVGVLPIATRDALRAFVDGHAARGVLGVYRTELDMPKFRSIVAGLIDAGGAEIAMLRNTGDGATILAQGLDLRPGDEIVTNRNEFGSNAYPWLALRKRGVNVRFIDAPRERMTAGALNLPGWRSVNDMRNFLDYDQSWAPDAARYEGGTPNFIGALSLATSVGVLQRAGIARIGEHVLALTDRLVDGLQRKNAVVDGERSAATSSGIVRFRVPGRDPLELGERIAAAGIVTTNRPGGIRVSPHGYNASDEIDALLELI